MHPQRQELIEKLKGFLKEDEDPYLVVHDPESLSQVDFVSVGRDAATGKVAGEMRVVIVRDAEVREQRALRLGLPAPDVREVTIRFGPNVGQVVRYKEYRVQVGDIEQAAALCLAVMKDVFDVDPTTWLWITDVRYDDWPAPLPKPNVWPPPEWRA